jgi:hypothetical protein
MQLSLQNQKIGDIVVIRRQGRIVVGAEISIPADFSTWEACQVGNDLINRVPLLLPNQQ